MKIRKLLQINILLLAMFHSEIYAADSLLQKMQPLHHLKMNQATLIPTGLSPAQVQLAYGFNMIPFQGEGQTIAIVSAYDAPTVEADLAVFNTMYNLPACTTQNGCFQKIFASGPQPLADITWALESNLAVQWVHAMAPKAKILLIEAGDDSYGALMMGVITATTKGATVVSMSWGGMETDGETGYDRLFNLPNVTFVAASGDVGNGTAYPAVSPYVLSVGGTSLYTNSNGEYATEDAWIGSGGGLSVYEAAPTQQKNFPIPNNPNFMRGNPDVAYHADPERGYAVYSTFGFNGWLVVGGTGAGAPQWAALIAIMQSAAAPKKLTNINNLLYTIAKQKYVLTFHEIVKGSNGSCGYFCNAQAGYNYVTGIGTPKVQNLVTEIIKLR